MLTASFTSSILIKKPLKRRRLTDSVVSEHPIPPSVPLLSDLCSKSIKLLVCSSCNRSIPAKPGHVSICTRCSMPTCNICSRVCTAFAPSQPPTPGLTYSPTPPATPPYRPALSLHTVNTNSTGGSVGHGNQATPPNNSSTKRRKHQDEDEEESDGRKAFDPHASMYDKDGNIEMTFSNNSTNGCGRVICRNCCFENIQNDTTTCYDCYGRAF